MSYWYETQARERIGEQLRQADEWRRFRAAAQPTRSPARPQGRRRLSLRPAR
jgi:hypothetical protein